MFYFFKWSNYYIILQFYSYMVYIYEIYIKSDCYYGFLVAF